MKIAITTDAIYPFTLGGSEIRNHEIAKRLIKKGHEVHILGGKFWKGNSNIEMDGIKIYGVSDYKNLYDETGKRKPFEPFLLSIRMFFYLLKEDYDLIDNAAFNFFNCYSTKLVSLINSTHLVFTWHQYFGNYLLGYLGNIKGVIARTLEFFSTKLTKNNLVVSNHVKNELVKKNVLSENIQVIFNGTDLKQIDSVESLNKFYDLIFVGRLNYQKNLSLLIKSVKILKKKFLKLKVCIVGEGEERENLLKLINDFDLKENFDFVGKVEDKGLVYQYLKSSRVFVLPSKLEGFPLTIIEANASGLPIVTTKTFYNNTSEYVKNNVNGLLVKPNAKDFSDAISRLLEDENMLQKMSKQGREKSQNFDWDKIAFEQEKYYLEVIKNGK
ncbi:glycosyltransferase family 4 protein [archaeon]|jgi:glycosyltransferase involved in cell wall biosynthesis|nr:glycosyltransferase family 4 protein [archaeon]